VITAVTKDVISKSVTQGRTDASIAVKAMNEKLANVLADNLRAKILYWKEALFSPTKKMGYRQMSNDGVIYWAAYDLHRSVPSFHPLSVEYFLVSFADSEGIRHAVEVAASSLCEAAVLAIAHFRRCGFTVDAPGRATRLTVAVKMPSTTHEVQWGKIETWLQSAGKPNESRR
jgi:hypothetical protein